MRKLLKYAIAAVLAAVCAVPSFAQDIQEGKTIKRKVAIGRFSNETQYAKGLFYDKENDPMRKQALDILSSKLAASGKFILLEREDLDVLVAEAGEGMNKIGADYIILGSITEYGRKTEGEQKVFSSSIPMRPRGMLRPAPSRLWVSAERPDLMPPSVTRPSQLLSASLLRTSSTSAWTSPGSLIFFLWKMVLISFPEVFPRGFPPVMRSGCIRKARRLPIRRLA